jgi:formylglycine-generating enzyme required for sulfatase activity
MGVVLVLAAAAPMAAQAAGPIPARTWGNALGMTFSEIPPGRFVMGGPYGNQAPRHSVELTVPFMMQTTPVTVAQFQAFVQATRYSTEAERGNGGAFRTRSFMVPKIPKVTWRTPGFLQTDANPVTCISWNDAQEFIRWLNSQGQAVYALPTEAQWEYACATDGLPSPEIAWYRFNSMGRTHPVAGKAPNRYGIYDMLGNVCEWCQDLDGPFDQAAAVTDPEGAAQGSQRVIRGGSWADGRGGFSAKIRSFNAPDYCCNEVGFRVIVIER